MPKQKLLAIFGGSFDPVHLGHLAMVEQVWKHLACEEIILLINHQSPLKNASQVATKDRLAMLELASADLPYTRIDTRELWQPPPSHTLSSLQSLSKENPGKRLAFILGLDSFNQLRSWYRWQEILNYCHLIVLSRPEYQLPILGPLGELLAEHLIDDLTLFDKYPTGLIYHLATELSSISSTRVRQYLHAGQPLVDMLSPRVLHYITQQKLYR